MADRRNRRRAAAGHRADSGAGTTRNGAGSDTRNSASANPAFREDEKNQAH